LASFIYWPGAEMQRQSLSVLFYILHENIEKFGESQNFKQSPSKLSEIFRWGIEKSPISRIFCETVDARANLPNEFIKTNQLSQRIRFNL
jgi:hypothetical protein